MTREEQIKELLQELSASNLHLQISNYSDYKKGLLDGIEWADKTMIDKACEWILYHTSCTSIEIKHFKKAMEE